MSVQSRRRSMAGGKRAFALGADDCPPPRFNSPIRLLPAWQNSALNFLVRRLWLTPIRLGGPQQSDDSFAAAASSPTLQRRVCPGRDRPARAPGDSDEKAQPIVQGIFLGLPSTTVLSRSTLRVARQPRLALARERNREAHAKCDSCCAERDTGLSRSFDRKRRKFRIKGS
jgi:hypothetical protein